ncbi:hypothetical protein ACQEUU_37105 [Nonomuraea sp. CA-218870]|uniref:hypothetical protein n=1 Tax=Nonomuraea sp. CA-218870 TaxID=3239998 RepID=UPI003D923F70
MSIYPPETTAALLKMREEWLRVVAIPSKHGGFDIAVVIDGSYDATYYDPTDVAKGWLNRIGEALARDGLPLGVPINACSGRATVFGGDEAEAAL